MTNERWLRWAIARHFREQGYKVTMRSIRVGNASIDGEVTGEHWRMALEIKSGHDDVIRGLGQLSAVLSHGYSSAALVLSLPTCEEIESNDVQQAQRSGVGCGFESANPPSLPLT